jgi:hypothetical protein
MTRYNLMHCVPRREMHGLNGYLEVIDTLEWGLRELGHEVSRTLNRHEPGATNIIFGAHVLGLQTLETLPADSIVYNFEQWRGLAKEQLRPEVHCLARRFRIWDYRREQLAAWKELGASRVKIVPVGYAPILQRIERAENPDIEVLMYGLSGERRAFAFHQISNSGLSAVFVSGLYGAARDALIARSRMVLNVCLYEHSRIFEIVRVSYLLANRVPVVAVVQPDTAIDEDMRKAVRFSSLEHVVDDCRQVVQDDALRRKLEEDGFNVISRRDIRPILEAALQ